MRIPSPLRLLPCLPPVLLVAILAAPALTDVSRDALDPSLIGAETFSESFTLIADLERDVYLQVQLAVSNFGIGDGKGGCRLLLIDGERGPWAVAAQVDREEWAFRDEGVPTLEIGECRLTGGPQTEVHARFARGEIRLRLASSIRPVRPLDRRMQVGDSFYESDVLIPWAPAEARIQLEGAEPRVLRGHGYGDKSRSTALPAKLADRWVRFRGLAESGSVLILARFPGSGEPVDGWVWAQDEGRPVALAGMRSLGPADPDGGLRLEATSAQGDVFRIAIERELYRFAPLEQRGLLVRMLRRVVGNPVTYTYRAVSTRAGSEGEPLRGIAEVTIVDES